MSDKLVTFKTYLERLKVDVNKAVDGFNDLTSDQASAVCDTVGISSIVNAVQHVENLREALVRRELDDVPDSGEGGEELRRELAEVRTYLGKLEDERRTLEADVDDDDSVLDEVIPALLQEYMYPDITEATEEVADVYQDDMESDWNVEEFSEMELPTLLTQIKAILNEYPDDGQIIKELVQNADDAKANELKILYDGRMLQASTATKTRYAKFFKAPALVVYNDAEFTDEDWQGIKRVYNSVKADDPLRVGRFGLGFKSVFHITDYPCIISGEKILFINPLSDNPGEVCVTVSLSKLERCKELNIEDCLKVLNGVFGFDRGVLQSGRYKGTMFWFPLRYKESSLSSNIYSDSKIMDLFRAIHSDSSRNMLFLRHIQHMSLYMNVPEDIFQSTMAGRTHSSVNRLSAEDINQGKDSAFYTAEIRAESRGSNEQKNIFEDTIRKVGLEIAESSTYFTCYATVSTYLNLSSGINERKESKWFIINYLHGGHVSDELRYLLKDESLGYLPIAGIAAKINTDNDNDSDTGHIFCYQPLPQDKDSHTGLQVHVNAFFALTQNRRHVKWPTSDQELHQMHTDSSIKWNKVIVTEILPAAYALFLEELKKKSVEEGNCSYLVDAVYASIPDVTKTTERWQKLAEKAIEIVQLRNTHVLFTANDGGKWVSSKEALIASFTSYPDLEPRCPDTIVELLLRDNINVVCAPEHVTQSRRSEDNEVTPKMLRNHLRKTKTYLDMNEQEKHCLLEFISLNKTIEDLEGIQLVPLSDGSFTKLKKHDAVFVSDPETISLFPGQEGTFISTKLPQALSDYFRHFAEQGTHAVKFLNAETTAELIRKTICMQFGNSKIIIIERMDFFKWESWLKNIWAHIDSKFGHQLEAFINLPIVPIGIEDLGDKKYVALHPLTDTLMLIEQEDGSRLPNDVCKALSLLSVTLITKQPEWIQLNLTSYLHDASPSSILTVFEHINENDIKMLNKKLPNGAKMKFSQFLVEKLNTVTATARVSLRKLKIFSQFESTKSDSTLVSIEENDNLYQSDEYPVKFPCPVVLITPVDTVFAQKLGGILITKEEMILKSLQNFEMYSLSEQKILVLWLLNTRIWKSCENVKPYLQNLQYLQAASGDLYAPKDLFDPSNERLKTLFIHESLFPVDGDFLTDECLLELRNFGLKDENQITIADIEKTCKYIDAHSEHDDSEIRDKATAVLKVLEERNELLRDSHIEELRFVPVSKKRPSSYPRHIPYISEDCKGTVKPSQVMSMQFVNLVGSVLPVVQCRDHSEIAEHFKWQQTPTLDTIVKHLYSITTSYEDQHKSSMLQLITEIYSFFEDNYKATEVKQALEQGFQGRKFIWYGDGFVAPECIFVETNIDYVDLKPFLRPLPPELAHLKDFFKLLGCFESVGAEACLKALQQIKIDSENRRNQASQNVMKNVSIAILNKLKNDHLEILSVHENELFIPVDTSDESTKFKHPNECVYCNASWLKDEVDGDDGEEIIFVHKDLPISTAEALGVPSLTQKVFADSDAMEEWGQEEPLTRRLRNILEEGYVDGFSIPKELFQNADDARASKMWIMYDERENENARKNLLSAGMSQWQGPALWVYNDAEFTEEDLRNITKLSGATKESDPCTIGKFGLGFCAVYNLTDVPSLISGENIVIFDPHMKYLGKALPGRSPGLKINVRKMKSQTLAKKLCNQFRPAENVFGCTLTSHENFNFQGTLFRFPLRRNQSSEISDIRYTSDRIQSLLQMLYKSAANLLLFNMHVKELKVFHVKNGGNPSQPTLMYETLKDTQCMQFEQNQFDIGSVLQEATRRKQSQQLNTNQLRKIEKIRISCSGASIGSMESNWLVSWATGIEESTLRIANEEEGAVPIGAIAVPFCYQQGEICPIHWQDLPEGFYKNGHFFFFLPLPIEHSYPFHINAPLAVSNDRRHLRTITGDDNEERFTTWNEALLGDCVVGALTFLLQSFQHLKASTLYKQCQLWPLQEESDELKDKVRVRFYSHAVQSETCRMFCASDKWLNIFECRFLDPSLRKNDCLGNHIVELLLHLNANSTFVDLPHPYYSQLLIAGRELVQAKTVDAMSFVLQFLLPNIDMLTEIVPVNVRDQFIKFAILLHDDQVNENLKRSACIPSRPNGELKFVTNIVDYKSRISGMFDICDGRFPPEDFMDEIHVELTSLGMLHDKLTDEDVLERAGSVGTLARNCLLCASERCNNLLFYLEENYEDNAVVLSELRNDKFLPLTCKPNAWLEENSDKSYGHPSCEMHSDPKQLNHDVQILDIRSKVNHHQVETVSPSEVTSYQHNKLIASVSPIVHCEKIPKVANYFGWQSEPRQSLVLAHFVNIVKVYEPKLKPVLLPMVINVYQFLSKSDNITGLQSNIDEFFVELSNKYIWAGDEFLPPKQIYVESKADDIDLKPYIKPLPSEIVHLKDLFLLLGCSSHLDSDMLLSVLEQLKVASEMGQIVTNPSSMRNIAVTTLNKLVNEHPDVLTNPDVKVFVPVGTHDDALFGVLEKCVYCSTEMAVDQEVLDEDEQDLLFVHSDVPLALCRTLGVPSLTQKLFSDSDAMEEWGQEEPLTRRLKTILDEGYVDGFSVPKELFQNADDAGASKMWILYDERENMDARKNLLSSDMAEWQGPALWVYNDAEFTEDDFQNITKLNGATKESDPCKIGKFGLGFCAVYNLTDVPSLISGENLVIFDPHMKYLGKSLPGKSPGMRINVSKIKYGTFAKKVFNQFKPAKNVFDCNLVTAEKKYFGGTLFRLPLRSRPSDISDTIYSKDEMKKLLDITTECAANLLLFNTNVKDIKIFHLPPNEINPQNAKLIFESCKSVRHIHPPNLPWNTSVLKEASERKKRQELHTNQLQVVDEVHIAKTSYNDLSLTSVSETDWLVSWATGINNTTLGLAYEQEGAVPVGSVALPVQLSSNSYCPMQFKDLPSGFYSKGHFYFFLPLPIDHEMPFHINGQFTVSNNRRSFRTITEEDTNVKFAEWNSLLLKDSVVEAVMFLFRALGAVDMPHEFNVFDIWPFPHLDSPDSLCNTMVYQFYQKVVEEDCPKTFRDERWLNIYECKFLEPELKENSDFGKFASVLFAKYIQQDTAVDIPRKFYEQLLKANKTVVMKRTVTQEEFLLHFFLPCLQEEEGIKEIQLRDKMAKFAVNLNSTAVDEKLLEIACIPTRPLGTLKHIPETVDDKSPLSALFGENEEHFIVEEFNDETTKRRLSELGMVSDTLKDTNVMERLRSISVLIDICSSCALERCYHVLAYLETNIDKHEEMLQDLQKEFFLPVLKYQTSTGEKEELAIRSCKKHKADGSHVRPQGTFDIIDYGASVFMEDCSPCYSRRITVVSPAAVCSSKYTKLIGSAIPVIECSQFESVSAGFGWLSTPKLEAVVEHFHNIVKAYTCSIKSDLLPMIMSVYKYLANQDNVNEVKQELTQKFADLQNMFVWFGDGFVAPSHVYVEKGEGDIDLKPFLVPLPSELSEFKDFFKCLGCFECINIDAYLNTLEELKNECDVIEEHNVHAMRRIAVSILNELKDHHLDRVHSSSKPVYFPVYTTNNTLSMKPVDQCVFCDADWLNDNNILGEEDELTFVHTDISNSTAEALGVSSLTDKVFSEAEAMEEWGQEEPLTRRLKNILKEGYVDGFSVPKELFQNADDAGATKLWMLYDKRENEDSRHNLLSEGMAEWQGPALWVYNDAEFSEEDFKNIIKLSGATKEADSCKIGKFGLGFCSVYNLTDVPSFISGENIVVLDPHMKYLGKAMPGKSPGLRINVSKIKQKSLLNKINAQFQPYEEVFGCKLISKEKKHFKGTLFRFPLRNQESDISSVIYSQGAMEQFLQKTYDSAANMFLFNMNVEELKIYALEKDELHPSNAKLMFEAKKRLEAIIPNPSLPDKLSLLQEVSQRKRNRSLESNPLRVLQQVNIERSVLHDKPDTSATTWLVSWATGVEKDTLKLTYDEEGAVPLGAVAVPYQPVDGQISPIRHEELPEGFYKTGHFFFFLPMPVEHSFPFHANGPFAVSSDRRKLRAMTDDDFEEKYEKWNRCLLGDSLVQALINLLQEMQGLHISRTYNFYDLWPLKEKGLVNELPCQFYRQIFESPEPNIFYSFGKWLSISRCVFLEPCLRIHKNVGKLAFDVLATFVETDTAVDLPACFYEQLKHTNEETVMLKTESTESFILSYFLPNIGDLKESVDQSERNSLTIFSILLRKSNIDSRLIETECIPTHPKGILRHIKDTVDKNASFAALFDDTDNRFPIDDFQAPETQGRLRELGMMSQQLPGCIVLQKAMSISALNEVCIICANERCSHLLKYLSKVILENQIINALQNISFLPVKCKPKGWHAFWKIHEEEDVNDFINDCEKHSSDSFHKTLWKKPAKMFHEKWTNLVGCVHAVIDLDICQQKDEALFKKLGIIELLDDRAGTTIVTTQLLKFAATADHSDIDSADFINRVVKDIYSFLERACEKDNEREYISEQLHQSQVVLVSGIFTTSDKVALTDSRECPPYLHSLKRGILSQFPKLCKVLDICDHFAPYRVAFALTELFQKYGTMALSEEDLTICNTLLQMLHSTMKTRKKVNHMEELFDESIKAIYAPDEDKVLRSTSVLCFNDYNAMPKSDTMIYVHASISPEIAKAFGVKPKLLQNLEDISEDIEDFYQEEPLTSRIRGLLDGYPCDSSVFKELLQNADDAGASEVHIIFDTTTQKSENVFDSRFKLIQGPALIVFNNKAFTQDDLRGIQKLGTGSKRDDPSKTGRYGVGFNAVYNVTDVPSFLTFGPEVENGETLCFFDPNARYIPNVTRNKPGKRYKNTKSIHDHHSNVIDGYHIKDLGSQGEGTVFRLPLRSKRMAEVSDIKKDIMSRGLVTKMLLEFQGELKNMLIFLKKVQKVLVSSYTDNRLTAEYTVEISMSKKDESERNGFFEYISEVCKGVRSDRMSVLNTGQIFANYSLDVSENGSSIASYKLVQVFGFGENHTVPDVVKQNIDDGNLGLLPYGGVALPLTCTKRIQLLEQQCRAFCFLPLPIQTGLSADIHGYFALSDETRRSLWFDTSESCYKTKWNCLLIEHVITPAYIRLLQNMKTILFGKYDKKTPKLKQLQRELNMFYTIFPHQNERSDQYWNILTKSVFVSLVSGYECFLPVVHHGLQEDKNKIESISWTSLYFPDCHFPAYAEIKDKSPSYTRDEILKRLGLRIVSVSEDIQKSMETARVALPKLNAIDVIDFLCSTNGDCIDKCNLMLNVPIEGSPIASLENCKSLLRYCVNEEHFYCQFRDMPLMVSQQGSLKSIGPDSFMYWTFFPDLFPAEADSFIHKKLYLANLFDLNRSGNALKRFTVDDFVLLLNRSEMKKLIEDSITDWQKDSPTDVWITKFWGLFWYDFPLQQHFTEEQYGKVQEMFNRKVSIVGHVSLLPVMEHIQGRRRVDLIKVIEIDTVINLKSFSGQNLNTAFSKMKFRELDTQCFENCKDEGIKLLTQLPNFSSPERVFVCLVKNIQRMKHAELTSEDSFCVLHYLFEHIGSKFLEENITSLKQLPLFVTHSGKRVDLVPYRCVVVAPKGMPKEGLEFLSEYTDIALLQRSPVFNEREKLLSFQTISVTDLYMKYIFPNQHNMDTQSFYLHVDFIFKLYDCNRFSESDAERLFSMLSSIAFIEIAGEFFKVNNFFSFQFEIFKTFCKESEFLPLDYRHFKYLQFFTKLGLRTHMDIGLFERFAREISQTQDIGNKAKKKSKLLANSLMTMPISFFQTHDLSRLSEICFLLPEAIPKELQELCSLTFSSKFICYAKAVQIVKMNLCWTTSQIIPRYAEPKQNEKHDVICKKLRISIHPQIGNFIRHCRNVGEAIAAKLSNPGNAKLQVVEHVMTSVYNEFKRLQSAGEIQAQHLEQLKDVPLVYFQKENMLEKASCVVIECHRTEEIPPYLNRVPSDFSLFNDVFLLLGAAATPSVHSYVMVLKTIKSLCGDEVMHPAELDRTKIAVGNLVIYLSKLPAGHTISCGELFLPNSGQKMQCSRSLVLCNNNYIRKRLGEKIVLNYFFGFEKLHVQPDVGTESFMRLDHSRRPEMLKDIIGEEMMFEDIKFQDNDTSRELERFLHSDNFASGLVRLTKHAFNSVEKKWTVGQEDAIIKEIQSVRVRNVLGMKTILTVKNENGRKIEGTTEKKSFHIQKDQTVLNIYVDTHSDVWFVDLKKEFAIHINEFLGSCFKDRNFILLVDIIDAKDRPDSIPDILDKQNIDPYSLSQEIPCSDFPKPGMFVPEKYHQYLDNDCGIIQEFDYRYIAYEVEDPLVEDMSDATPTYVFAEIKRKLESDSSEPLFQMYEVDIGEDDFIEVPAFKLYKFIRKDTRRAVVVSDRPQESGGAAGTAGATNTGRTRNMRDVLREIRRTLQEAWKKGEQERRQIVKRLLLKWHPDKNPGDEQFCTKVFQYLQQCLEKLGNGSHLSDNDSDDEESSRKSRGSGFGSRSRGSGFGCGSWGSRNYWDTFFESFERRNRRNYERYGGEWRPRGHRGSNYRHSGFSFDFSGVWSETFSYRSEAKRWQRQAKSDYESANECFKTDPSPAFNWICYKCHQAVEKALKAAWYLKDANHARSIKHSRDLMEIADELPYNIRALTRQLTEQTGASRNMRYPMDSSIPAENYNRRQASKSCQLAEQILKAISDAFGLG